jgi:hypothetical protein
MIRHALTTFTPAASRLRRKPRDHPDAYSLPARINSGTPSFGYSIDAS